jgi:hypothetical protein
VGVGSTLVPVAVFVSASEGDEPDCAFSSSCSTSFSNEGEGSLERMGEADMEVERREAEPG